MLLSDDNEYPGRLHRRAKAGLILLGRRGLNQQQCVIKLHIWVTELETVEFSFVLAVSSAKKVLATCALDDCLLQNGAALQTWQVDIPKCVLPKSHRAASDFVVLPIKRMHTGTQMDR